MATELIAPGAVLSMTAQAADRILGAGQGDCALLYLYLLRHGGTHSPKGARQALGWAEDRVQMAFSKLGELGLVDKSTPVEVAPAPLTDDRPPDYTMADVTAEMAGKRPFAHLVREVERQLGKVLSTADLKTLLLIYDHYGLPAEVIFMLVGWCVEEMGNKYGVGRRPTLSQLKKEADRWCKLGVDTADAADAHIRGLQQVRGRERSLMPILGISGRTPVEKERTLIASWVNMGFDDETIGLAYERTVMKKGERNWAYMNSILKSWHQKGLHTVAQVETGDSPYRFRPATPSGGQMAPKPATQQQVERVQADLDWMDTFLEKTAKEGR